MTAIREDMVPTHSAGLYKSDIQGSTGLTGVGDGFRGVGVGVCAPACLANAMVSTVLSAVTLSFVVLRATLYPVALTVIL